MNKIETFEKFLDREKTLFDGGHNIRTPFNVVEEICTKIKLTNNSKVLVLFNVEFIIELVYNQKVPVGNITFYTDHDNKSSLVKKIGVKNIIKDMNDAMKFDVILTNPPYDAPMAKKKQTKKIWQEFIHKALDSLATGGSLGFVCPPSWILSNDAKLKKIRNRVLENNLTHLRLGVQQFFPTVDVQIGYFILEQKSYLKKTKFIDAGENKAVDIDFNNGIPLKPEEQYRLNLVDKIIDSSQTKYRWSSYGEDSGKSKEAVKKLFRNNKILKLIINYSKAYYTEKVEDNNMPITTDPINNLQVCLSLKSKKEGLQHKSFLHSKAIRWLANNYKRRGQTGFCDAVKRQIIPQFETKMWTDKEVYKAIGLDAKEISYIESNL